jgi:predicted porin
VNGTHIVSTNTNSGFMSFIYMEITNLDMEFRDELKPTTKYFKEFIMFKKTLVAAALSTIAFSASAYEIGVNDEIAVEVYGVAAISMVNYNATDNRDDDTGYILENESRVGFRAGKNMTDDIHVFLQIESGYVGNYEGAGKAGSLGVRDTFIGLGGDWGQVRFGRVLTPMYEIIDWPFSNPGLGTVFDWGGDVKGYYDRHSDQIRYDSANYGGFKFAVSTGRGDRKTSGSNMYGANATYTFSTVTLMGATEYNTEFQGLEDVDALTYLVGFEAGLPGGFSIAGAYKAVTSSDYFATHDGDKFVANTGDGSQGSYSLIAQYWNGPLGLKAGYAANLDSEQNGQTQDDADSVASFQVMGVVNGFVPYVRVAARMPDAHDDTDLVLRVGLEYGF